MKNNLVILLLALAALASCRESNMNTQGDPLAATARVLRYDTTFIDNAQDAKTYHYVGNMAVGNKEQTTIPVEINWTATQSTGCPQVASLQVYQLNGNDRRAALTATAQRDAVCRPARQANGNLANPTGSAIISLTGTSKETHMFTSTKLLVNALGSHDSLSVSN